VKSVLITGAQQREGALELGDGKQYQAALLLRLNLDTGEVSELIQKSDGGENYPDEYPNIEFTAGCLCDHELYLCTDTEIFIYKYPELELITCISHPAFQNIHHVYPRNEDILIANTGLDMIVRLDKKSHEIMEYMNVQHKDAWHRFDQKVDYRKVHSTKPHDSHPNYVFEFNDSIWATRCIQKDAVNLSDSNDKIDVNSDSNAVIHDGIVQDGKIYFTSVDGHVIIVDQKTKKVLEKINLNIIEKSRSPLGWCRGLHIENDHALVGFTRLRKTKIKENVRWVKHFVKGDSKVLNTRVVLYDLRSKQKVREFAMPAEKIHAIYSILSEPDGKI